MRWRNFFNETYTNCTIFILPQCWPLGCIEAFLGVTMTFDELKEKARSLPLAPGVYIMRDKSNNVIYVGKAKKLKNRVSQYFQDTVSHSLKTRHMVSKIDNFDVIVAASEFEALVLECSLIKRHMPKYNILLKDDKGYPYLRLNPKEQYPRITMVNKIADDGAEYYGPFGSRSATNELLEALRVTLKLPDCGKTFPRDVGKSRPCLNYHMNQCSGWCQRENLKSDYDRMILQARQLLQGNYKAVASDIRQQMLAASDALNFEVAASLRDKLQAVETLGKKQLVTAGTLADTDVIGYGEAGMKACFVVLHFSDGNLLDKDYTVISVPDDRDLAVSSLLMQYYMNRGYAPKRVLLPFSLEDSQLFAQFFFEKHGKNTRFIVPQRGANQQMVDLAKKNAIEEAQRLVSRDEKASASVLMLEKMLSLSGLERMEAYDISNISGSDIVASMVVFQNGKPVKREYKKFKIENMSDQDDYASMQQVLSRRFDRYLNGDVGFLNLPDILLIDGGETHAKIAVDVLKARELEIPVFGMVKDDRHRTRALITRDGHEIAIDTNPNVFALIGNIQEEAHRFAITYHRNLRRKRLKYSELDAIPGIGPKRKQDLLRTFGSISAMRSAHLSELERLLPGDVALAVYRHFHNDEE